MQDVMMNGFKSIKMELKDVIEVLKEKIKTNINVVKTI